MTDRAKLQLSRRKARDRSMVLVLIGSAMLMPPLIDISLIESTIGGIPMPVVYVFVVWLALICGAVALSRPLLEDAESAGSTETSEAEP